MELSSRQEWKVTKLTSLAEKIMVGIASAATHAYRAKGIPMFRNQNIKSGHLDDGDLLFITPEYETVFRNKRLRTGDLVTMRTGYPGVTAIVPPQYDQSQSFTTLITRPKKDAIDSIFLCHYINSEFGQKFFEHSQIGGAQKNVNASTLRGMPIPVPPRQEQLAIGKALSDVDALIAGLEKLIAKKRDLKQAAMQQLLTGQIRLPGFSGEWARNDLKNLVSTPITDGPHLTPTFYETGVPFLSVNNLANNRIDWSDLRFISKADDEIFSRKCKPRKGDVLLGKAASVGKVAIVEDDIDFNIWSPIALIRAGAQVNAKFLYYQLLSADCISQVMLLTNASSQGNIGMGDIEKIQISYPCYEEQEAIAEVLADMDAELGSLEARLAKTRELKQGMMQELLTGRTRLV